MRSTSHIHISCCLRLQYKFDSNLTICSPLTNNCFVMIPFMGINLKVVNF